MIPSRRARLRQAAHLDSNKARIKMPPVRTTVTLDQDVERLPKKAMHQSRRSFKETLNAAVRSGLSRPSVSADPAPFVVRARPLQLRPGFDPAGFNRVVDDLEAEAFLTAAGKAPNA